MNGDRYVLDASVAAKWLLPPKEEELVERSLELLGDFEAGRLELLVPDLFWVEMGNIFWKAARTNRMTSRMAKIAFASVLQVSIPTMASTLLLENSFDIAARFQRSFYDSVYLALAESSGFPLLTADELLASAVAAYLPVKWLGAV